MRPGNRRCNSATEAFPQMHYDRPKRIIGRREVVELAPATPLIYLRLTQTGQWISN